MPLPNNSNLPPGVSYSDIDPPPIFTECSTCSNETEYVCDSCSIPTCDTCVTDGYFCPTCAEEQYYDEPE